MCAEGATTVHRWKLGESHELCMRILIHNYNITLSGVIQSLHNQFITPLRGALSAPEVVNSTDYSAQYHPTPACCTLSLQG